MNIGQKKRRGLKSQGHQLRLTRNKVCTLPRKLHGQKGEQRPFKISKERAHKERVKKRRQQQDLRFSAELLDCSTSGCSFIALAQSNLLALGNSV